MGADQFLSAGYNRFVKILLQISGMDSKKDKQGRAKKVSVPVSSGKRYFQLNLSELKTNHSIDQFTVESATSSKVYESTTDPDMVFFAVKV